MHWIASSPTSPILEQRGEAGQRLRRTSPTSRSDRLESKIALSRTGWGSWRSRPSRALSALIIACAPLIATTVALHAQKASDDDDLSKDQDYREELGVNEFTAPSIEKLFNTLDSLKPIPINALVRPVTELNTAERSKYALSFGVLIGDGFLDV